MPASDTSTTITTLVREIDLEEKTSEFSEGLSGGQKRKLSVGIALIGDPRILCLGTLWRAVVTRV